MKNLTIIFFLLLVISSCGSETEQNSNDPVEDQNNTERDTTAATFSFSEPESFDDILGHNELKAFEPYDKVDRYVTDDLNHFQSYKFKDLFEFAYPEEPVFEQTEKDGYQSHQVSTVHNGTIYSIEVLDYSKDEAFEHDLGFVQFTHNEYIEYLDGMKIGHETFIETMYGLKGYYSYYSFDSEDKTYKEDLLTLGFDNYLLMVQVTSRPKYEAKSKVQEFVNAIKLL